MSKGPKEAPMEAKTETQVHPMAAHTAAVIRAYNNRYVRRAVERLQSMGVNYIVVVTNKKADRGATRGWLDQLLRRDQDKHLIVLELDEYSWTRALNAAIRWAFETNALTLNERASGATIQYLMPVSVEAQPTEEQMRAMFEAMAEDPKRGLVGVSFKGVKDRNEVGLGVSYKHPRNTLALWRLAIFRNLGEFGSFSDEFEGQEDIAKLIEMEIQGEFSWVRLDLQVRLLVDINYNQGQKEQNEEAAIARHFTYYRNLHGDSRETMERLDLIFARIRARIGME